MNELEKISLKLKELECLKNALEVVLTDEFIEAENPELIELVNSLLEYIENYILRLEELKKNLEEFEELEEIAEKKKQKSEEHNL